MNKKYRTKKYKNGHELLADLVQQYVTPLDVKAKGKWNKRCLDAFVDLFELARHKFYDKAPHPMQLLEIISQMAITSVEFDYIRSIHPPFERAVQLHMDFLKLKDINFIRYNLLSDKGTVNNGALKIYMAQVHNVGDQLTPVENEDDDDDFLSRVEYVIRKK